MPAPSFTDWLQAVGGIGAAWVGVGALLYDRRIRRQELKRIQRAIHAWVRYVDDDPDPEVAADWFLFLSNASGAPVESWYIELSTSEGVGSGDMGPLPPGTLRRRIEPAVGPVGTAAPTVTRLVFRQRDGIVVERAGHDRFKRLRQWPDAAAADDALAGARRDGDGSPMTAGTG